MRRAELAGSGIQPGEQLMFHLNAREWIGVLTRVSPEMPDVLVHEFHLSTA